MRRRKARITWQLVKNFFYWWTGLVIWWIGFSQLLDEPFPVDVGNQIHYDAIKLLSETVESKIDLNLPEDKTALKYLRDRIDPDLNGDLRPGKNLAQALKEDLKITPDKMPVGSEIADSQDQKAFDQSVFGIVTAIVTNPTVQFWGGYGLFVFLCWHGYL